MKPSKKNKTTKIKLDALQHPGTLQMLVDFWEECPRSKPSGLDVIELVATTAVRLKVMYMNDITPVRKVVQKTLEQEIAEVKGETKRKSGNRRHPRFG